MDFRSFPVIRISLISLQVVYSLHIEIVSQQCLFALIRNLFGDYKRTVSLLPLAHSLFLYSPSSSIIFCGGFVSTFVAGN